MNSWRTTALGVATILTALGRFLGALMDSDPATVVDLTETLAMITAGVGLIAARDNRA